MSLKTLQVKAPYRGINKLPAEPVVVIRKTLDRMNILS